MMLMLMLICLLLPLPVVALVVAVGVAISRRFEWQLVMTDRGDEAQQEVASLSVAAHA